MFITEICKGIIIYIKQIFCRITRTRNVAKVDTNLIIKPKDLIQVHLDSVDRYSVVLNNRAAYFINF